MEVHDYAEKLREFIESSSQFAGFTMNGLYGISTDEFLIAFRHFVDTGENVLDEHAEIIHLKWDQNCILPKEEIKKIESFFRKENFWNIDHYWSSQDKVDILNLIERSKSHYIEIETYEFKRLEACKYTSNPTVRKKIFKRDGRICKHCKTNKNLTLDHIIPISKGGQNILENLQILCKSCNSKKGTKIEVV